MSFGVVALLLAGWAFFRRKDERRRYRIWLALALVGIVFALGPVMMRTGTDPLLLPLAIPAGLRQRLSLPSSGLPIPLPAAFAAILPVFSGMRAFSRFALLGNIAFTVLAACGLTELAKRLTPSGRRWLFATVAGLTMVEFASWPFPLSEPRARPVDAWLRSQPGQFTVLEYPRRWAESGPTLYYTMHHGKRTASGYTSFFPPTYRQAAEDYARLPDTSAFAALLKADIRYVMVDSTWDKPPHKGDFEASPWFVHELTLEGVNVFRFNPPVPARGDLQSDRTGD